MRILFTFIFAILFSATTYAQEQYNLRVLGVVDGDTVRIEAPFLPKELKPYLLLRVYGVDTPEKGARARCSEENMASLKAKLFVEQEISYGKMIRVVIRSWDKYGGRILGDVIIDGIPLSQKLIAQKYAVKYKGKGKKKDWCA
jgi:endonuclease YncB( thermonuclease family)